MTDKKFLVVFGTRPEAIKMAPLVKSFQSDEQFNLKVCVTAQHREMLDQVLTFFDIKPDFDLNLMAPDQSLNTLTGRLFLGIDQVYATWQPDLVFVHGDTTTSSMCALAAFHRRIKVAHVEAGLRTHNKWAPFPEEINRQITGRIADLHFAPTETSKNNLLREGVPTSNILVTGNTVIDALHLGLHKIENGYTDPEIDLLKSIVNPHKKLILITGHRRENFGTGLIHICKALKSLAQEDGVQIIYPVHLNPNVQDPVHQMLGSVENIHLISPLGYPAFLWLMKKSYLILTDSGGIQEEAPSLGKPVLVMRDTTERPEAIEAGTVKLVGTDYLKILNEVQQLLQDNRLYFAMSQTINPYGDGKACKRIKVFLKEGVVN